MDNEDTQPEATAPDTSSEHQRHRVLKPGESFGNFRVVRCISAGLLANYYQMQHVRDLHDVTVGIFHPRTIQDPQFLKRLQGLQKTFQGFTHEGIPHLRDCAEINERHCIFLDMVEDQTLSQYFAIHGSPGEVGIGIEDTTQKMALILGLLGYANVHGVDHRDLDSDLIFVKEDGTLQVLGLGIKSAIGRELFESIVSASVSPLVANKTAGRLNSFDIMSPEYRAGVSEGSRVDVYAVGVIGYWLLTAKKADQSNWAPPSTMVNDLSGQWDDFLMKMITREVEDRYQSCKVALLGLKETGLEPESEQAGLIQRQIDRIPVPKGILKRGELAARVYRLSILGVVGLILAALAASLLNVSLMEVQEYTRDVAMVAEEEMQPDLRLHVQPMVSKIELKPAWAALEMTQLEAPLIALPSSLTIRSEPAGAGVFVNAVEVGITPITLDRVEPSDDYLIELHLDGYRSTRQRIVVAAGEEKNVEFYELQPRSGELSFEPTFDAADPAEIPALMEALQVELDGKRLPFGAGDLKTVPEGRHEVRLLHPFYGSELKVVDLQDREVRTIRAALSPLPGIVELVLPGSLEFQVRVNQQAVDVVDSKVSLPANELVELELRIENNLTMVRRLELSPNERIVWEIKPVTIPGPTAGGIWMMPYRYLVFAWIDPGSFIMGSPMPEHGRLPNEGPLTTVRFTAGFWMGAYEVTQSQYQEIMGRNPSGFIGPNLPVENVSWEDAKLYCRKLTDIEKAANRLPSGYVYRLPTEMEWEYAARAGSATPFSFGDRADASMGNFRGAYSSGSSEVVPASNQYGTVPVGSYEPNVFGVYDMHGNVREWSLDHYNGRLRGGSLTNPAPHSDGSRIAARGGSWGDFATRARSAARDGMRMDTRSNAVGFRVVLAPERE
jgi:formylglycine-generating enzyme required for sulfatase activity